MVIVDTSAGHPGRRESRDQNSIVENQEYGAGGGAPMTMRHSCLLR